MHTISRRHKLVISVLVVGLVGLVSGMATFSAFTATTSNAGNEFAVGTVAVGDNSSGDALYNVSNQRPGVLVERCITVTYTGSLASDMRLYASAVGVVGDYIDLAVTPGTGTTTYPSCDGFVADVGGALFAGTLKGFADTHSDWASGLGTYPASATEWLTDDAVVYRFALELRDDDDAQGLSTGAHAFTWEAQNQ